MTSKKTTVRKPARPSRKQAQEAVETLLLWAGEDPRREGLRDTPRRVAQAYEDWFSGYKDDPVRYLGHVEARTGGLNLRDAKVVVACGRGIGGPEHIHLAEELAARLRRRGVAVRTNHRDVSR